MSIFEDDYEGTEVEVSTEGHLVRLTLQEDTRLVALLTHEEAVDLGHALLEGALEVRR